MATTTVRPTGTAAVVGGVLWALLPVIFTATHLDDIQRGTLAFVAVAAAYWVFGVLPMLNSTWRICTSAFSGSAPLSSTCEVSF